MLIIIYRIGAGYFDHPTVWDARHVVGAVVKIVPLIIFQIYMFVFALSRFASARQDFSKNNNLVALETLLVGVTNEAIREELQLRGIDAIETRPPHLSLIAHLRAEGVWAKMDGGLLSDRLLG